jgi:hypothetical protein
MFNIIGGKSMNCKTFILAFILLSVNLIFCSCSGLNQSSEVIFNEKSRSITCLGNPKLMPGTYTKETFSLTIPYLNEKRNFLNRKEILTSTQY